MSARLRSVVKKYSVILGIGLAYLVFVLITGWGIPCIFNLITGGLKCPACGVTHMILAAVRLDLAEAYRCNPFLFLSAPIIFFLVGYSEYRFVKTGSYAIGTLKYLVWAELVLAITFGVIRNFIGV